jgi:hypothetical protein
VNSMWLTDGSAILVGVAIAALAVNFSASAQTLLSPSYAVVIGITNYERPQFWRRLSTAEPDAKAIQALLQSQGFTVTALLGPNAKRETIVSTLRTLARKIEADRATSARVVVYFAGHGATEAVAGTDYGYLIPWDATNDNVSYVSMDDIRDISDRLKTARHQLFLLDSCFGGLLVTRDQFDRCVKISGSWRNRFAAKRIGNR